jgi:hypothetical protein
MENTNKSNNKEKMSQDNEMKQNLLLTQTNDLDEEKLEYEKEITPSLSIEEEMFKKNVKRNSTKLYSSNGLMQINSNYLLSMEERMESKKITNLIKHLISFENLKYLKLLKNEVKELVDKNNNSEEKSITGTSTNEFNMKLHDYLKPGVFNEIFENLISKYFQGFYKSINTNPKFINRIENILLYFYKIKNNMDYNTMVDLDGIFNFQGYSSNSSAISQKSSHSLYENFKVNSFHDNIETTLSLNVNHNHSSSLQISNSKTIK